MLKLIWNIAQLYSYLSSHYLRCSEATLLSIMQIMAMAAARAHARETRATFIKFSTIQTLHVSMHPALKAAPGILGLSCPQTWLSLNTSEEAQWGWKCSGWLHNTATLGRERNAEYGQSGGLCCTGHQWTSKCLCWRAGYSICTELFSVTFYSSLKSLDVKG